MVIFLTILHVLVSLFLIIVVLLQSGKAADLAGAFGGMGSQTAFGPRGAATILSKATTMAAVMFMLTSIALGGLQSQNIGASQSVIERTGADAPAGGAAPAVPANETIQLPPPTPAAPLEGEATVTPTEGGAAAPPPEQ